MDFTRIYTYRMCGFFVCVSYLLFLFALRSEFRLSSRFSFSRSFCSQFSFSFRADSSSRNAWLRRCIRNHFSNSTNFKTSEKKHFTIRRKSLILNCFTLLTIVHFSWIYVLKWKKNNKMNLEKSNDGLRISLLRVQIIQILFKSRRDFIIITKPECL